MTDFQTLLQLRDERRAAVDDARLDAIMSELKADFVSAIRTAADALNQIDCAGKPGLAGRIDSELAWLRAVGAVFAEPDA
jgi:hypothetical protein